MRCPYRRLRVAIPGDALSTNPSLREKTLVAGYIARAVATLRAEGVDIYGRGEGFDVLLDVLMFLSTPVYLRKKLFPLKPTLKYAGILPPVTIKALNEGFTEREERYFVKFGLIESCMRGSKAIIDVGEEKSVSAHMKGCKRGKVVMVFFKDNRPVKVANRKYGIWRGEYLGFEVRTFDDVYQVADFYKSQNLRRIGTSKRGEWPGRLREFVPSDIGLIFGHPSAGLPELYPDLDLDALVNTLPCQGVKTVRLEEALWATTGLILSLENGLCE